MASLNHTKGTRAQTTRILEINELLILISYDEVVIQLREICLISLLKLHDFNLVKMGGLAKSAIFFSVGCSLWLRKHAWMVLMRLEWLGTCEPEQQHVCMQLDVFSTTLEVFILF